MMIAGTEIVVALMLKYHNQTNEGFFASITKVLYTSDSQKFQSVKSRLSKVEGKEYVHLIVAGSAPCSCPFFRNDGGDDFVIGKMSVQTADRLPAKFVYPASLTEFYTDFKGFINFSKLLQETPIGKICPRFANRRGQNNRCRPNSKGNCNANIRLQGSQRRQPATGRPFRTEVKNPADRKNGKFAGRQTNFRATWLYWHALVPCSFSAGEFLWTSFPVLLRSDRFCCITENNICNSYHLTVSQHCFCLRKFIFIYFIQS